VIAFRGRGVAKLGFFLGQETQDRLPPRLIGLLGEETPVVLDVETGNGSVHTCLADWETIFAE